MSNPTDDKGNVRVDFAWGNMPLQPNDGRVANGGAVLDPLLDNHEIVYTGRSGFPGYVPGNSTPPAPSGITLVFENIEDGIDTEAVSSRNEYGQLVAPFQLYVDETYSESPAFYTAGSGGGPSYGAFAGSLRISLSVDETTPEGEAFFNAWWQQQTLGTNSMGSSASVPQAPDFNPEANFIEFNTFAKDVANLLPRISLKDAYLVDSYGEPRDIVVNYENVPGNITDNFSMTDDVETNVLVPGTWDMGPGGYLNRGYQMTVAPDSNMIYTLRFSFPAYADMYGGFPNEEEAAFIGDEDNQVSLRAVADTISGLGYGQLYLGGTLEITLPAAQPVTTPLTLTLEADLQGIDTPELNSNDMYDNLRPFYLERSYTDPGSFFGTSQGGDLAGMGLRWELLVEESTPIGKRFKQAWEEQQSAFGWLPMNGQNSYVPGVVTPYEVGAVAVKDWYAENVPSLPVFDFSGMTFTNDYGSSTSEPLTANVATDSDSFIPGGFDGMGMSKYIIRRQSDLTGWASYEFRATFTRNYDVYGGTPTQEQFYFAGESGVEDVLMVWSPPRLTGDLTVKFYN